MQPSRDSHSQSARKTIRPAGPWNTCGDCERLALFYSALPEGRIFLADQRHHGVGIRAVDRRAAFLPPPCEGAAKDQVTDLLRIAHRIGDRDGAALRDAEQGKPFQSNGLDHSLKVTPEGIEGEIPDVPVRETVAARVISDELVLGGNRLKQRPPDRIFPVVLEMVQPIGRLHEWRALPDHRIGNLSAVRFGAEADFLPQRTGADRFGLRAGYGNGDRDGRRGEFRHRRLRPAAADLAHKAQPLARDSTDQRLLLAAVANRLAGRGNPARQCRVGHNAAAPDRGEEIILADDSIAVLDQVDKKIEDLRLNLNAIRPAPQFAAADIERMAAEVEPQEPPPRLSSVGAPPP